MGSHGYSEFDDFDTVDDWQTHEAYAMKVAPAYDGRTSFFAFEDAIDDWCDITELEAERRGPALGNRLDGDAAQYKRLLDRELLKDPVGGVRSVSFPAGGDPHKRYKRFDFHEAKTIPFSAQDQKTLLQKIQDTGLCCTFGAGYNFSSFGFESISTGFDNKILAANASTALSLEPLSFAALAKENINILSGPLYLLL